jgi:predicted nicotinamide N-methyase
MSGVADADGAVADEGDWYAALVAGEHVGEWLETCENPERSAGRRERAVRSLAAKVASDRVYADEATEAGAAARLEAALASLSLAAPDASSPDARARQTHASLRDALEAARAACADASGVVASVRELAFGLSAPPRSDRGSRNDDVVRVRVRELALGRGVGAKLWRAASMLSDVLFADPAFVRGQSVLELGAGVGLCGLLAAKLGAKTVALTDFEPALLDSLALAARENRAPGDAETRVARCDWREEKRRAETETEAADVCKTHCLQNAADDDADDADDADDDDALAAAAARGGWLPALPFRETFDRIVGSELVYERTHAETLPFVLRARLAKPLGVATLVGAVRDRALLDALVAGAGALGLDVAETRVAENKNDDWYDGGYVQLRARWKTERPNDRTTHGEG